MQSRTRRWVGLALVLIAGVALTSSMATAAGTREIPRAGSTSPVSGPSGVDGLKWPEFPGGLDGDEQGPAPYQGQIIGRSDSGRGGHGHGGKGDGKKAKSNPELKKSFDGLNFRDQRVANGGNQFSVEPPDQGLCAGNGFVVESVNDVMRVFRTDGSAATGVVDLNTFYGYPAQINRTTGEQGPFVTDPSCYFDVPTQRWFQVVLTLDVNPATGDFLGSNHLDIAVSQTSDPTAAWAIYRLPVQDDGTDGTPNHGCGLGPCIGDYPHIGADANGFYITTNEYSLNASDFHGAQIYALSKAALVAGAATLTVNQIDTHGLDGGNSGFTLWPAQSPGTSYDQSAGGTEYFLSSNAADEAHGDGTAGGPGSSTQLLVWALTNTSSLNSAPALTLNHQTLTVGQYAIPPRSEQKTGDFPLGQCINDTTMTTPFGPGCWQFLFNDEPAHNEVISHLDSNDTRMQQVVYANGRIWGALDTALTIGGVNKAGIEYFVVKPKAKDDDTKDSKGSLKASIDIQGYLGLPNNNLTYPAIGVTSSGRGVMAFTVVGTDHYPSAGYAGIDAQAGTGDVHVAAEGLGPSDGFTSYKAFVGDPPRTRWGDYGAAAADGSSIWIASEYIGQTCTLAQYASAPFGSCGGTRGALGNWDTRISKVTP
jgi:hypothetical protein